MNGADDEPREIEIGIGSRGDAEGGQSGVHGRGGRACKLRKTERGAAVAGCTVAFVLAAACKGRVTRVDGGDLVDRVLLSRGREAEARRLLAIIRSLGDDRHSQAPCVRGGWIDFNCRSIRSATPTAARAVMSSSNSSSS